MCDERIEGFRESARTMAMVRTDPAFLPDSLRPHEPRSMWI